MSNVAAARTVRQYTSVCLLPKNWRAWLRLNQCMDSDFWVTSAPAILYIRLPHQYHAAPRPKISQYIRHHPSEYWGPDFQPLSLRVSVAGAGERHYAITKIIVWYIYENIKDEFKNKNYSRSSPCDHGSHMQHWGHSSLKAKFSLASTWQELLKEIKGVSSNCSKLE